MIKDTDSNSIYLYHNMAFTSHGYSNVGIIPNKLEHIALAVKDIAQNDDFYHRILHFSKKYKNTFILFTWLRYFSLFK